MVQISDNATMSRGNLIRTPPPHVRSVAHLGLSDGRCALHPRKAAKQAGGESKPAAGWTRDVRSMSIQMNHAYMGNVYPVMISEDSSPSSRRSYHLSPSGRRSSGSAYHPSPETLRLSA